MRAYLLYRAADCLSRGVPRSMAYAISRVVSDQYYRKDQAGRTAVISNLRRVLGFQGQEPDADQLSCMGQATFRQFGKCVVEFFRYSQLTPQALSNLVHVEAVEHLDAAVAMGRGVLQVTLHLGNWELGGAYLASRGHSLHAVVLPQEGEDLNALFRKYRRRRGIHDVPLGNAAREVLQVLKRREFAAVLADRDYTRRTHLVDLFGAQARLPRGPAWLCKVSGSPLLPGFLTRTPENRFVLRFFPPIVPVENEDESSIQNRLCRVLENAILRNPTQWFVFQDLWNGRHYER